LTASLAQHDWRRTAAHIAFKPRRWLALRKAMLMCRDRIFSCLLLAGLDGLEIVGLGFEGLAFPATNTLSQNLQL